MQFAGIGGKANHVVHDYVDTSTNRKSVQSGKIQRLRPDSLAGKCRVAMQDDWKDFPDAVFANMGLLGASAAQCHWVHRFEMTGVRDEMHAHGLATARAVFA